MYTYIYMYSYTGLKISGFASQNTNQFQAKCESFPPKNSPCVRIN